MSETDKIKTAMRCVVSSGEDCSGESSGIAAEEFSSDKYWERRCHRAEGELQAIARELERVRDSLEEKLAVIASLEQDNLMLSVQLDMVHLIFGHK